MTKRRIKSYILDGMTVLLIIFGIIGSLGAFEAGSIGIAGLIFQSSLAICGIYGISCIRNAARRKVRHRQRVRTSAPVPALVKSA